MTQALTGPFPGERPASADARMPGADWVLATRWARDPNRMTGDELQSAFDNAPLGCTLVMPAQEIGSATGWVLRLMINLWFATGTGLRGDFPAGSDADVLAIDIRENGQGSENRDLRIFGNGGRVLVNRGAGFGGAWAVTIGTQHARGGWATMGLRIDQLGMTGGRAGALLVDSGRPPGGVETAYVTISDCDIDGGVLDRAADGTRYLRNRVSGDVYPAYRFDKVPGAYNTRVEGGFATNRGGALDIINGDRIGFVDVQCEHFGTADNIQDLRAMAIIRGRDRPAAHNTIRDCNFGAGDRVARSIVLQNAYGTLIENNQFMLSSRMVADVTLGDAARDTAFVGNKLRGPRRVQPRGTLTDPSRRLVVQPETTPHGHAHVGLVLPLDTGLARFAPGWRAGPAGLDVLIDGNGIAHLSGSLIGGGTGLLATLPAWLAPHRDLRLAVPGPGAVMLLALTMGGGEEVRLSSTGAIPDGSLDFGGVSWLTRPERDYYPGL